MHIKALHLEVRGEYGWPHMWKELSARGIRVGKERIQKPMQQYGTGVTFDHLPDAL